MKDLIESMEDISLSDDETLLSFDVKSLFTSIPVNEAIQICEQSLRKDITLSERTTMDVDTITCLLRFCLTNTAFQYDNKHYRQKDGVAMGSPASMAIADTFLQDL